MEENKEILPFNAYEDGTCRTLKAQCGNNSAANFVRQDGLGATAVVEIEPITTGVSVHPLSHAHEFDGNVNDDVSPCLRATDYKAPHCVWEPQTCASRKRGEEHKLEIGKNIANSITTIDTDSMVAEPSFIVYDDYNGNIPKDQDVMGTITTNIGSSTPRNGIKLIEPQTLTSCRTEEGRELRKQGIEKFENRELVPREDGVSGTITTVQKDNLLAEPLRVKQATKQGYIELPVNGVFDASYPNSALRRGRVQENGEVSPTLTTNSEGAILRYEGKVESNPTFLRAAMGYGKPAEQDIPSAVTSSAYAANNFIKEPQVIDSMQENAYRGSTDGVAPCVNAAMGMGGGHVPMVTEGVEYKGKVIKEGDGFPSHNSETYGTNILKGISPMLRAEKHDASTCVKYGANYRIRKLTERECFRLMDVSEEDIDKIQAAGISKSAQYRLAGNSIVVSCLYHIFRELFIDKTKPQQGTLF